MVKTSVALLILFLPLLLLAQDRNNYNVSVMDTVDYIRVIENGKFASKLQADDLIAYVNGKRVNISNIAEIELQSPTSTGEAIYLINGLKIKSRDEVPRRHIIFFFDAQVVAVGPP